MSERLEAVVSGQVQMVMYRDFTERTGKGLNLVGTVKNISDGTVAVVAEGDRPVLERFLKRLGEGSLLSRVDAVVHEWKSATGEFTRFTIIYD